MIFLYICDSRFKHLLCNSPPNMYEWIWLTVNPDFGFSVLGKQNPDFIFGKNWKQVEEEGLFFFIITQFWWFVKVSPKMSEWSQSIAIPKNIWNWHFWRCQNQKCKSRCPTTIKPTCTMQYEKLGLHVFIKVITMFLLYKRI